MEAGVGSVESGAKLDCSGGMDTGCCHHSLMLIRASLRNSQGTTLEKYGRHGSPKVHFFRLSSDDLELQWESKNVSGTFMHVQCSHALAVPAAVHGSRKVGGDESETISDAVIPGYIYLCRKLKPECWIYAVHGDSSHRNMLGHMRQRMVSS